jgi:hypothetical protein
MRSTAAVNGVQPSCSILTDFDDDDEDDEDDSEHDEDSDNEDDENNHGEEIVNSEIGCRWYQSDGKCSYRTSLLYYVVSNLFNNLNRNHYHTSPCCFIVSNIFILFAGRFTIIDLVISEIAI